MKTGVAAAKQQMQQARTVAGATKKSATVAIIVIVLAGMILGAVMNLAIIVSVNRALNNMIDRLRGSVEQTLESATQVSTASKSLADGASTQAASIEESSSSLEELASMTQINAENAQKTNELAREARSAADRGADDVQSLNTAMSALQNSSNDISKIIRTIDEIAFQTNILALNAAVEAARAGEAGMGFAVVADEVRTLAQRSATAAKETAVKIEGTMGNTGQGVQISAKVVATLQEIVAKVHRVDELAAEAAGASREQSQGIQQINQAVGQMDRVTQSNAANAEQSSAAAEELKAQAEVMRQAVNELSLLVGGERQSGGFRDEHPAFPLRPVSALRSDSWARPAGRAELKPRGGAPAASKATVMMAPQSPLPDAGKSLPG
jgi:methyl-accepting chemotaxis protein